MADLETCPHGVKHETRQAPSVKCDHCQREVLARMDPDDWRRMRAAIRCLPRLGSNPTTKPHAILHPPKPPKESSAKVVERLRIELGKAMLEASHVDKLRAVLYFRQSTDLMITATDGHRMLLEPADERARECPRQYSDPMAARLVLRPEVALALKRVSVFAPPRMHSVAWRWDGQRLILAASCDGDEASEWVDANPAPAGAWQTCLSSAYIQTVMGSWPLIMDWPTHPETDPITFYPEGADWRYVVMPMRFN